MRFGFAKTLTASGARLTMRPWFEMLVRGGSIQL
jgi:hypothetical protein